MNDFKQLRDKVQSLKLLVVEDEQPLQQAMAAFMKKFFDHVDTADNGQEALAMLGDGNVYDVLLTDVMMPKMTGLELIERLVPFEGKLFLAVMSGTPEIEYQKHMFDFFIQKPMNLDTMVEFLNAVITKKGL